ARPSQNPRTLGGDVKRRNNRGAVQPAEGAGGVLHFFFEGERARVRLPARESRLELIADRWAHVKEAGARSATQPLEYATGEKIGLAPFHVNRDDANGVKRIKRDESSDFVRPPANRVDIHQVSAAKQDVRDGDQARPFVDRTQQSVDVDPDPIL